MGIKPHFFSPFIDTRINTYRENPNTHYTGEFMLEISQLWTVLRSLFTDCSYGQAIEKYIVSRNPQTPSDVERYTVEFQQRHGGGQWL